MLNSIKYYIKLQSKHIIVIISIKLMNRLTTDPTSISIRIQDITSPFPPARAQIYRPINPELTPLRQNKSEIYKYGEKEQLITSPFQKDQFLNEYDQPPMHKKLYSGMQQPQSYIRNNLQCDSRGRITSLIPQVLKMQDIPSSKEGLSRSWTNQGEHRETVTYLEQIINDLSDKKEYQLTRRYIQKLQNPHMRQKLEIVLSKLESKQALKSNQVENVREGLIKILRNYFRYERSIELSSVQRLMKQLQKSMAKLGRDERSVRRESQQKVKELKEESKLLNSKLEKETRELYKALEQEKAKIKENYEQIYRKIYEENNKLKKEFETKEAELRIEKAETEAIKIKYEGIFTQISHQFKQIKHEYNKLVDTSSKQTGKNKNLTEQIKFISEKLRLEATKTKQLEQQLSHQAEKYHLLEDEKVKLEMMSLKYKDYAQKFLSQTKKYQNERYEKEKVQSELRESQNKEIKKYEEQQKYFKDLEMNIRTNEEILCNQLIKIQENQYKLQEILRNIETKQKESHALQEQTSKIISIVQQLQTEESNLQIKLRETRNQIKNQTHNFAKHEEKKIDLMNAIANQQKIHFRLTEEIKNKEKTRQNLERQLTIINQEILEKKERLLTLRLQSDMQQMAKNKQLANISEMAIQIQSKVIELKKLEEQLQQKKSLLINLESQQKAVVDATARLHAKKQKLQSSISQQVKKKNDILVELNQKISEKQQKIKQYTTDLTHLSMAIDRASTQYNQLEQQIKNKQKQVEYVQELLNNKTELVKSIESKLIELESSIEYLEKSNSTTMRTEPQDNSILEQMKISKHRIHELQNQKQCLISNIQSLKSKQKQIIASIHSLQKTLKDYDQIIITKRKEKEAIEESTTMKYEQLVLLQSQILMRKRQLDA